MLIPNVSFLRFFSLKYHQNEAIKLYKHLLRQCQKLPKGPKEHYRFMIKQSYKQHVKESDPERIKQIIERSYDDCNWILKKVMVPSWSTKVFQHSPFILKVSKQVNSMFQIPLATSSIIVPTDRFWNAIMLYHNRPHLVNRKIAAVSQGVICEVKFQANGVHLNELLNRAAVLYELRRINEINITNLSKDFMRNLLDSYDKNVQLDEVSLDDFTCFSKRIYVSVRLLFPRMKNCPKAIELVTFDLENNKVNFLAVSDSEKLFIAPPFPYEILLTTGGNLCINVSSFEDADTAQAEWLVDKLFLKLIKWIENVDINTATIHSLSLVKVDEYCLTYNRLKGTYGDQLVKEWPKKTGTDPQKYVFEDIAIASYLLCLWKNDTCVKFVDCGCGNGLLVYLLNQEGFIGFGLDVRRRPTWDMYPETIDLKVETIGPNSVFPDCTWIIGNHSDELTPWLPVIALKSSPRTNFFVLPCCPYDFNGRKYIRKNTTLSTYADYLTYVEEVCNKCGFETKIDKLRIPSTKRACLVGRRQSSDMKQQVDLIKQMTEWIDTRTGQKIVQRSSEEKVRNCTQLNKNLISNVVGTCMDTLLASEHPIKKPVGEDLWNKGGQVAIKDLVQAIPQDMLKELKKECGGLQTLLRNHRYLFEIKGGLVSIRLPVSMGETSQYKNKPCWFRRNHPNGCLYDESTCGYSHE